MAYKIISEDEPLFIEAVIILIFGEPGIGKSSLAMTAKKSLLEDFDGGIQRAIRNGKVMRMDSWEDAVQFHHSGELEKLGIESLIFDTTGTMLDNYMAQAVIRNDPKNAKRDGSLALGGYGAMKNVFNSFVNEMKSKNIDLIFIAHDDDENIKDTIKKKPKIAGGSYDIIKGVADLIGYMETEGDKRVIDFNPCDRHVGKNSAQIAKQVIPDFSSPEYSNFMARLISQCKNKMNEMSETQTNALKIVKEIQEKIAGSDSIELLNPIAFEIEQMSDTYRIQLSKTLNEKYGAFFNDLLKDVKYTVQMDSIVELVKNAPELVKKHIRSSIMVKVRELGFKWNDEMGIYLDKTGKPSEPSEYDNETNDVGSSGSGDASNENNQPSTETDQENTIKDQGASPAPDKKVGEDKTNVAKAENNNEAIDDKAKNTASSATKNQKVNEPKIF